MGPTKVTGVWRKTQDTTGRVAIWVSTQVVAFKGTPGAEVSKETGSSWAKFFGAPPTEKETGPRTSGKPPLGGTQAKLGIKPSTGGSHHSGNRKHSQ